MNGHAWLGRINTVLFDLDGTLTLPVLDFPAMRRALAIPDGESITHALQRRPEAEREAGLAYIRQCELEAARNTRASPGAVEFVNWLHGRGTPTGIITRNFREAVDVTLDLLGLRFEVIITRDCAPPKPAPDPIHEALRRLRREAATTLMVGDYHDDMQAGKAAGTFTCLVNHEAGPPRYEADMHVRHLGELQQRMHEADAR